VIRVHAIHTGTAQIHQRQLVGEGRGAARVLRTLVDRRWAPPVPIRAWLIEHPEGLILVDTGESPRVSEPGYLPRWHPFFRFALRLRVRPEEALAARLAQLGVAPGDIRWVVLTHLHSDHVGGLAAVSGCEIVVSETEYALAAGRPGRLRGYLPQHWPSGFAPRRVRLPERPYGPFPRSLPLTAAGDVVLLDTAGHTPGHISVLAADGDGPRLCFAGDAAYTQAQMLQGRVDGIAPDDDQALDTLSRLQRLVAERPTVFLPTHDPESDARLERREPAPGALAVRR
jgi:glyoxylase-like metal-dependent hydrolase (beta-lactamase superfamily II)